MSRSKEKKLELGYPGSLNSRYPESDYLEDWRYLEWASLLTGPAAEGREEARFWWQQGRGGLGNGRQGGSDGCHGVSWRWERR